MISSESIVASSANIYIFKGARARSASSPPLTLQYLRLRIYPQLVSAANSDWVCSHYCGMGSKGTSHPPWMEQSTASMQQRPLLGAAALVSVTGPRAVTTAGSTQSFPTSSSARALTEDATLFSWFSLARVLVEDMASSLSSLFSSYADSGRGAALASARALAEDVVPSLPFPSSSCADGGRDAVLACARALAEDVVSFLPSLSARTVPMGMEIPSTLTWVRTPTEGAAAVYASQSSRAGLDAMIL